MTVVVLVERRVPEVGERVPVLVDGSEVTAEVEAVVRMDEQEFKIWLYPPGGQGSGHMLFATIVTPTRWRP